jgi:hypothetical protein
MKLVYDKFDNIWVWVSLENENIKLSPDYDEEVFALQWLFDIEKALGHINYEE